MGIAPLSQGLPLVLLAVARIEMVDWLWHFRPTFAVRSEIETDYSKNSWSSLAVPPVFRPLFPYKTAHLFPVFKSRARPEWNLFPWHLTAAHASCFRSIFFHTNPNSRAHAPFLHTDRLWPTGQQICCLESPWKICSKIHGDEQNWILLSPDFSCRDPTCISAVGEKTCVEPIQIWTVPIKFAKSKYFLPNQAEPKGKIKT